MGGFDMGLRRTYRHIRRRQQIVGVLIKNGLGYLVESMGLDNLGPVSSRYKKRSWEKEPDHLLAFRLRQALVELGPTFIKLGQLLSTRPDLLPPAYIQELERLQDKVSPLTHSEVISQLCKEIGHPEDVFAEFDPEPLAAASIGQVHLARLKTGEKVIVKVQRPGIEQKVRNDLEIVTGLAQMSERRSIEARRIGLVDMIEDYAKMFLRELDYAREARNTERVYYNFSRDERVLIPKVYWDYTTDRVLTEEYIPGVKLSDIQEIDRRDWDRRKISELGTETFLSQVILHGFFQADPHPGNIIVVDESHIAFIDFGEIGSLSEKRLMQLGELLFSFSKQNMEMAMAVLHDMGIIDDSIDIENFQEDFADLIDRVSSVSLGKLDMNRLRREIMDLAYRYHLRMPAYLTGLMKALITVEGVGKKLDPTYNFMDTAKPLATKVYQERLKPENIYKYLNRKYYQDIKPLGTLPANINHLLRTAGKGNLSLKIEVELSKKSQHKISQMVSRLSASLIITGALIGSSMIIQTNHAALSEEYAYLGVAAFALALFSLVVFLISSLRP